ncbi:MAG: MgtC/SapB family protein [Planctomycetota bacterium]|nr:MgtC/SapB family protein [Planctomycetota bacterium]
MTGIFTLNIGVALLMGLAIGAERQLTQHPAGLRTNGLVSVGAAMFVSLSLLMDSDPNPTRIAAQVVSGIGFLGGGVILREGLTVKGMTTAATLWCSAAVGTLAGAGFVIEALIGTATILAANFCLRPVSRWLDSRAKGKVEVETNYRLRVVCDDREEGVLRTIVMRHVNSHPSMLIHGIFTQAADQPGKTAIVAEIYSTMRDDRALQDVVSRINIEPAATSCSWERLH